MLLGAIPTTAGQGVLDGKVFIGATGDKGKDANDEDELKFEDGKFYSVGCERWKFGWGEYTTTMEGDLVEERKTNQNERVLVRGFFKIVRKSILIYPYFGSKEVKLIKFE
jgi:hypothetical protein